MHTMDWKDPNTGIQWHVHHNGDFSGDVIFDHEFGFHQSVEEHGRVEIPFDLLKEMAGRYIQDKLVANIEDMSGSDTIDRISDVL